MSDFTSEEIKGTVSYPSIARWSNKKLLGFREYKVVLTPSSGDQTYSPSTNLVYNPKLTGSPATIKTVYSPASYHISRFNFTTGTTGAYLDGCANCIIDRVSSVAGDVIMDCRKTNVYTNIVLDATVKGQANRDNYYSFFGAGASKYNFQYNINKAGVTATTLSTLRGYWASNAALNTQLQAMYGTSVANSNTNAGTLADIIWAGVKELSYSKANGSSSLGDYILAGANQTYAQFIPDSIIGTFATQLFPLSECASYELTFYLETLNNAFVGDMTAVTIDQCRLHLDVIEINETLSRIIRDSLSNVFIIPTTGLEFQQLTVANSTSGLTQYSWPIPLSLVNCKGLMFSFFDVNNDGASYPTLTQRCKFGMTSAQLQIGQYVYPANRLIQSTGTTNLSDPEFFLESMKYFNNQLDDGLGCINYWNYNANISVSGTGNDLTRDISACGQFFLAFNLEGIFDAPEYRACQSVDPQTTVLTFTLTTGGGARNIYIMCHALYEMDLVIANGVLNVKNKKTLNLDYVGVNASL